MEQRFQILNSKLLLPRSSDTIRRERLYPLLGEIPKKRLTTVIAGAGYGKTTLIAEVGKYLGLDTVWYSLDTSDRDFMPFLSYLIEGLKRYSPELGVETFRRIDDAQILNREREAVLTVFLSEIEKLVKNDLIIVLDDYHLIQDSNEINESLKFLLEHLPPLVHLIIISRSDPDLPLSKLRAIREVLDIREADLVFTLSEIGRLYLQLFDIPLQNESIKILYQKTDGWVSGLILFYHSLRGKSPGDIEELLLKLKGSHQHIADYLAENVYDLQPDEIKDFLVKTSILSRIDADFCNHFLEINNSRNILKALVDNHLFTFPYDEERQWYYYHHLFQDFLLSKLHHELSREGILNLHRDAAILCEKRREDEEALSHYLMAEQLKEACMLLNELGKRLLKEGRLQLIHSYLKKIPESYIDKEPWIQYTKAKALELSGKPKEAIHAYKKAHKTFSDHKSPMGTALCLNSLSNNYLLVGDFTRAETKLMESLNQVKDNPSLYIEILTDLIFVTSHLGKLTVADQYYKEAVSLLKGTNEKEHLAWLYLSHGFRYIFSGDYIKALEIGEKIKEMCEKLALYYLLALGYHLISRSCYCLGLFSEGMRNATKGFDLAKERDLPPFAFGLLLLDSSLNATALGKTSEAINDGKESLRILHDQESRWGQALAYHVLYCAYLKSDNLSAAEQCARSGIEVIEGLTLPMAEGVLKGNLAESLLERGQWEDAQPLLEDAEKLLKKSKLNLSKAYLLYARFYWEQKQKEAAVNKLLFGLQLSEANQYDTWVIAEKKWIMPLLVEIFAQGKMHAYLQRIFKEMGSYAKGELTLLQKNKDPRISKAASKILDKIQKAPSPGLRVYCLGKFKVFRGDEEISADRWKSKKAKMLFKCLIYTRSRGYLAKEVLMELLWPEEDPKYTASRLQVALSSLRRTLEPEIIRGTSSSYLAREGNSYRLCLGDRGFVDVDNFTQELKSAKEEKDPEKAISHYLNAESLYGGDFLEEDIYAEWCREERERLKEKYLDVLTKTMEHFERGGDYPRCIEYARKYLDIDQYAEEIYQRLMKYYSVIGNKAMVARTFERCKENMMKGFDSPLSNETEALFRKLGAI